MVMEQGYVSPRVEDLAGVPIPIQQWLDKRTRIDELLLLQMDVSAKQADALQRMLTNAPAGKSLDTKMLSDRFWGPQPKQYPYEIVGGENGLAMDTARADVEFHIGGGGDFITGACTGSLDGVKIKFNSRSAHALPIKLFNNIPFPATFNYLYVTHTIQAGKTLFIKVGREAGAMATTQLGEITTRQAFYTLSSDKDLHFVGALATGIKEDANLTGLLGDKIRIESIAIQADEALNFYVLFFRTDGFDNTDLDLDTFCGMANLDLASYGKRVGGANQYYLSAEGIDIDYEDEDASQELHAALYNASAAAKTAAAAGEVRLSFNYVLRS